MKTKAACLLALLLLAGLAVAQPARAQVYNLYQGNTFSYNGLNFTVSACSFSNNSASSVCDATNYASYLPSGTEYYIAADPSAGATSVIIEALNGGSSGSSTPIFSYTCGAGSGGCDNGNSYDLGITLTVTPASGTISSAVQTMTTTSDPSDPSYDVGITETLNPASDPTHSPEPLHPGFRYRRWTAILHVCPADLTFGRQGFRIWCLRCRQRHNSGPEFGRRNLCACTGAVLDRHAGSCPSDARLGLPQESPALTC